MIVNIRKHIVIQLIMMTVGFLMFSCSDNLPGALDTSDKETVLTSIRLMNVGENGDVMLEGVVDEEKKEVVFPRIDPKTNFENLKFQAVVSNGGHLVEDTYSVELNEESPKKSIMIRVANSPRYRDYLVSLELKIPPIGADFGSYATYDYSSNPMANDRYANFTGSYVRGSGFNGTYVLVVDRDNSVNPHVLKVSDLKENRIAPVKLLPPSGQTFTGGTFIVHSGQIVGKHIYVASLSGNNVSPLKIYHWTDPTQPAELILNTTTGTISGTASYRFGDNMSINLDDNGNGNVFFVDNGGVQVLRYKVTNYTNFSDGIIFPTNMANVGSWASYNKVEGSSNYLFTGHQAPVRVVSEDGAVSFTSASSTFSQRLSDVRVFTFNKERYLMGTTAPRVAGETPVLHVYSINRGENIVEALQYFEQGDKLPVFKFDLYGPDNINPATQSLYHIVKDDEGNDEKLMLYSASCNAGFVFFEFSKKIDVD